MDTSEDDKRVHEALITCCNPINSDDDLRLERVDGEWWAGWFRDGVVVRRGHRSMEALGASPEGALIALARKLTSTEG